MVGWVFFRSDSFDQALVFLVKMFSIRGLAFGGDSMPLLTPGLVLIISVAILVSTPVPANWLKSRSFRSTVAAANDVATVGEMGGALASVVMLICLLVVSLMFIAADTYSPFLYFRF